MVEGALRHGIKVRVALPLSRRGRWDACLQSRAAKAGSATLRQFVDSAPLRRQRAKQFMDVSGFTSAIVPQHIPGLERLLSIDTEYDRSISGEEDDLQDDPLQLAEATKGDRSHLLSRVFPLRWFSRLTADELRNSTHFLESIVALKDLGLSPVDAQTITNVVFQELIENVSRHADEEHDVICPPHALVGAIALSHRYRLSPKSSYTCLTHSIEQISKRLDREHPIVQLFIGDSGLGIPATLGPHFHDKHRHEIPNTARPLSPAQQICLWSFTPWSTRELDAVRWTRGTRGLWRARQVLRNYGGFVTIRSADALVGWTHTANHIGDPLVEHRRLWYMVGTIIDCSILPGLDKGTDGASARTTAMSTGTKAVEYSVVTLDPIGEHGISAHSIDRLIDEAAKIGDSTTRCVIAVLNAPDIPSYNPAALEDLLTKVSNIALTGTVVLVSPGIASGEIAVAAASLDAYRDKHADSSTFPILFLNTFGEGQWLGARPDLRDVLDQLFEGRMVGPAELARQYPTAQRLWNELLSMPEIVCLDANGNLRCVVEISDIFRTIGSHVAQLLKTAISSADGLTVYSGTFSAQL